MSVRCFNCQEAEDVRLYSFDLDLPTITGCKMCIFALSVGDMELLVALKPRKTPRRKAA